MSKGKITILAVVILAVAISAITLGTSHSSKDEIKPSENVAMAGSGPKHFSIELIEDVNIKSNP